MKFLGTHYKKENMYSSSNIIRLEDSIWNTELKHANYLRLIKSPRYCVCVRNNTFMRQLETKES